MEIIKKQEKQVNDQIKKTLEEIRFQGLKAGDAGIEQFWISATRVRRLMRLKIFA